MTAATLPPAHRRVTLDATAPPVVLGCPCPITGAPLRAGDEVVICDARPGSDPMRVEGWATAPSCPHCGAATATAPPVFVPAWGSATWATPPPAPERPARSVLGPLIVLVFLGALAIAAAALVFSLRTRDRGEPVAAVPALTSEAATAAAATAAAGAVETATVGAPATTAATAAAPSPTSPAAPTTTPLPAVLPSPTVAPTQTPEPLPATPTAVPPEPPSTVSHITDLVLVNPANERSLRSLRPGDTVDLSELDRERLTVRADVDESVVESVMFLIDGEPFCPRGNCVENTAPYFMGGDQNGDAYEDWDWSDLVGSRTLTAIACTGDNATGECFPALDVTIIIRR